MMYNAPSVSDRIRIISRLGWYQYKAELRRHYSWWRVAVNVIPVAGLLALIKLGLVEWIGGSAVFQWVAAAYIAVALIVTGVISLSANIISDQEDGTLLRAKTLPAGFPAHLAAKLAVLTTTSLLSAVALITVALATGALPLPEQPMQLLFVLPFIVGGVAVCSPIGFVAGGLAKKLTHIVYISLVGYGWIFISDIFTVPGALPSWLTWFAKMFPFYWLGAASRQIFLSTTALSTSDWLLGVVVVMAWAAAGIFLAPRALRKLSRRQSGSRLEKSRLASI